MPFDVISHLVLPLLQGRTREDSDQQHIGAMVSLRDVPKIPNDGRKRIPKTVGFPSIQDDGFAFSRASKYAQIVDTHQEVFVPIAKGTFTVS